MYGEERYSRGCSWKIESLETLKTLTGQVSGFRIIFRMGGV